MNKNILNYIVDLLMLASFVIVSVTGLVVYFFLPGGVKQGRYQEFMGIEKYIYSSWHDVTGIIFSIMVIVHFVLHCNWMIAMTKTILKK